MHDLSFLQNAKHDPISTHSSGIENSHEVFDYLDEFTMSVKELEASQWQIITLAKVK